MWLEVNRGQAEFCASTARLASVMLNRVQHLLECGARCKEIPKQVRDDLSLSYCIMQACSQYWGTDSKRYWRSTLYYQILTL